MKAPVAFGIVSLGVLAFACAPRPHGADTTTARNARPQRSNGNGANTASSTTDGAPRIESALDVKIAESHDAVRFDFRVTNAGAAKVG